jgi:hypothetical protein
VRIGFLFVLVAVGWLTSASGQVFPYHLGVNALPGFLIAHREDSKNLEAHVLGFEIQLSRAELYEKPWSQEYRKPRFGVNIMYMDLGHPELTGKAISVGPNFETTIYHRSNDQIHYRVGTGVGYLTKKFDPIDNRRNQAIGSNFNGLMQMKLMWLHQFNNLPIESTLGFGLTHFSNGSFRVPNLGVNMPSLILGLNYGYGNLPKEPEPWDTIKIPNWNLHLSYAFKSRSLADTKTFNIYNFGLERILRRSLTRQWRLGADLFFDKTHYYIENPDKPLTGLKPLEMTELGFFAGHQWLIYRVHVLFDVGLYAYKPSNNKFFTYQRLGFKYHMHKQFYFRTTLKTHFGVADFIDWGIGYVL